jgi:hypothetical protein
LPESWLALRTVPARVTPPNNAKASGFGSPAANTPADMPSSIPTTFVVAIATVLGVAVVATFVPAQRIVGLNP